MATDVSHPTRRAFDAVATLDLPAEPTFDAASTAVLAYLHAHVPLAVWTVSRVENGRQTHLYIDDQGNTYGLAPGESAPWEDTFCINMVAGTAPAVAPDARRVPEYVEAASRLGMDISAYAGAMITEPGGGLFGMICGLDPEAHDDDEALRNVGPLLQLLGQMLSMVLVAERSLDGVGDALMRAQLQAETDALTGLFNRRAWQRVVEREEQRLATYADPVVALMVDLDRLKQINDTHGHAAGDDYIRSAGTALSRAVRESDVVARLGGDEFGALLLGCTDREIPAIVDRIDHQLAVAGVEASVGWASITSLRGFRAGLADADAAMYAAKARRRSTLKALPA